jgi:hypothetical protein
LGLRRRSYHHTGGCQSLRFAIAQRRFKVQSQIHCALDKSQARSNRSIGELLVPHGNTSICRNDRLTLKGSLEDIKLAK